MPVTGYINQQVPRAGFYFSTASMLLGAVLLFFVGFSKREAEPIIAPAVSEACLCVTPPRCESAWCACGAGGATTYCAWSGNSCSMSRLPKSLSYGASLNRPCCSTPYPECCRRIPLRPSRSVPEGLARGVWSRTGSCRSCPRREHHLIEQITTSV